MNDLGIRHLQVRLPSDEYDELAARAKSAGVSLQQYVRQILVEQLQEDTGPLYPKTREWHDLLEYVLENDREAAECLKANLRLMAEAIQARKGKPRARRARGA